jgi:unsaturated rhamnogalacturonyl hydrolase
MKAYGGIIKQFIKVENGQTNLHGTVAVSGLGGKPYRDGSYEYYMSEPVIVNDPKGVGAFIKAAVEMEMLPKQIIGKGKTVLLDYYFNDEWKEDATGATIRWHYTWEDKSNGGFAMLGDIFNIHGVKKQSLESAPTAENLKNADIYWIVDPDTEKETERPNFINQQHIKAISDWVKKGGVLVLMGNDAGNAEFTNFNKLTETFGVHLNEDKKNLVEGNQFEQGAVIVSSDNPVFKNVKKLYIKELASLHVTKPATTVLSKGDVKVAAIAKYGKGTVFIIGDPWLYNEYVDGRKLPADFDNYEAATDLVQWLIKQVPKKK